VEQKTGKESRKRIKEKNQRKEFRKYKRLKNILFNKKTT